MTTTTVEPELNNPQGYYGVSRVSHVKNLLSRANSVGTKLDTRTVAKMRKHHQVSSCLIVQSLPLLRADWEIECEDDDARETLTSAYETVAFHVHRSMSRALWAGYSPNTMTWTYRDDLRGIYPTEIRDLEPSTCEPATDQYGTLDGFTQQAGGGADPIVVEAIYALWIAEGMESGNYFGRSILDAALDPWADHAAFRAFHARYLERFGEPVVVARAPAGKSIRNVEAIDRAVALGEVPPDPILVDNMATALETGQNLRHHSVVALPSSLLFGADGKPTGYAWNLDFLEAKSGGGTDFLEALREADKRIARAMFVPDLLSGSGDTGGSVANALGQTHKSIWSETVEGRLDDYSRQITAQLLEPMRALNFPNAPRARLVFRPLANEELDREWSLVEALVNGDRLPIDGRQLAEKYGLPVAEEEPLPPPAADLAIDRNAVSIVGSSSPLPGIMFAAADPVAGLPDWRLPQSYDPPPFRRELNSREQRVGFARLEDGLNRTEAATIGQLVAILDVEHDRVLRQLNGILSKGSTADILAALGTVEIKGGPAVVKAWTDLMAAVSGIALVGLRDELAAYVDQLPDSLGTEGRALFKSYATTNADRALAGVLSEVRLELLNAYTSGVSKAGMAAVVGQVFDAYSGGEGKTVRLTTRMLSSKSLNYSRAAAVERGGIPLAGAQYSAVLDRRTCDLCEELDEAVIPIEHTDLSRFTPPVHHNCRCVWVWITREEPDFTPTWSTPATSKIDRYGGLVF